MKQSILHSRFKADVPKGVKISITRNLDKIYYKDKKEKVIISELDVYKFDKFKSFIKPKIISDGNGWFNLMLDIDTNKFEHIVENSYLLKNRKLLFSILSKCYNEKIYNYFGHMTLNLFEDTMNKKDKINFDDVPWMISKEFCSFRKLYQYPKDVIQLGSTFVDFKNGIFYGKPKRDEIILSGGILLDKTGCFWMNKIKELIKTTDQAMMEKPMFANSTLIICSQLMVQSWKNIFCEMLNEIIVLTEKKHHTNLSYGDILKSKILIVSNEFLNSKGYSSSWDEFQVNNEMGINQIFKIIKGEFSNYETQTFNNLKSPNLSILKWKRVIMDSFTLQSTFKDKNLFNLLETLESNHKWIQITSFPFLRAELIQLVNLISGKEINYPLFKTNGSIYYINDLIRVIDENKERKKLNKVIVEVNLNEFETTLSQAVNSNNLSVDEADEIIYNFKTKGQLKEIGIDVPNLSQVEECPICLQEPETNKTCITKCGHVYCFDCLITNLEYSSKCPLCREQVDTKNIYTITRVSTMSSKISKLNYLLKKSKNSNHKNIIYVKNYKEGQYLSKYLEKKKVNHSFCSGRIERKNNIISSLNKTDDFQSIILLLNDNYLSKSIKNVSDVYFLSMTEINSLHNYCGYSYLNGELPNVNIFFFRNIIEQ